MEAAIEATRTSEDYRRVMHNWAVQQTWSNVADRLRDQMRANMPKEPESVGAAAE